MLKLRTLRLGSKGTYVKKLKMDLNGLSNWANSYKCPRRRLISQLGIGV